MISEMSLGPVPFSEDCQQVGTPEYDPIKAKAECRRYIAAIRATVGPEPEGARLSITRNAHDFGTYLDVVCFYDDEDEFASQYASHCECSLEYWPEGASCKEAGHNLVDGECTREDCYYIAPQP